MFNDSSISQSIFYPRFRDSEPLAASKYYTEKYDCDLAIPSYLGIGSCVCYTPLVEALSLKKGRLIKLLTAPLNYYKKAQENGYAIWDNNPYIEKIINADEIDPNIMVELTIESDNFCQSRHIIENICFAHGLRPRQLRGSLFLSHEEMQWGLKTLAHLKRPVVCICPYGTSSSTKDSPWHLDNWLELVDYFKNKVSFLHIGNNDFEQKTFSIFTPKTTIRQAMALIWASDLYVGFDTGPSHIATAFQKPTLVLWDAVKKASLEEEKQEGFSIAHLRRWSYPQNQNLVIVGEKKKEVLEDCLEFILEQLNSFNQLSKLITN